MRLILLIAITLISIIVAQTNSEDIPGFFLKVTKNVPRLGRRSGKGFEDYFRKASKSVPRIGRRNDFVEQDIPMEANTHWWLDRLMGPAKRAPVADINYFGYNLVQPLDSNTLLELISKDLFPSDQLKFIPWKDFDDALQKDQDLYVKIVSLGKDPARHLHEDLNLKKFVPLYNNVPNDVFYYKTLQNGNANEKVDFRSYNP